MEDQQHYSDAFGSNTGAELQSALSRVATGLAMMYWSLVGTFVLIVSMFVIGLVAHGQPDMVPPIMVALSWAILALTALSVAGTLFCLATPEETGARSLLVGSVVFMLIGTTLQVAGLLGIHIPDILNSISAPTQIVSAILFVLFLRKLAQFLAAPELAKRATRLVIAGIIGVLLGLAMAWLIGQHQPFDAEDPEALPAGAGALMGISLALLVVALYAILAYLTLLRDMRRTILGHRPAF